MSLPGTRTAWTSADLNLKIDKIIIWNHFCACPKKKKIKTILSYKIKFILHYKTVPNYIEIDFACKPLLISKTFQWARFHSFNNIKHKTCEKPLRWVEKYLGHSHRHTNICKIIHLWHRYCTPEKPSTNFTKTRI